MKIKSEHVARVSDVGTLPDTGAPYMVMEFLEGRDLSQQLERDGVLPITDAVDYLIQGCEAIAEAHSYGIVHRDLKPANLFLSKRPDGMPIVKVLDFGISKDKNVAVDNLTKTTAMMGSALYMSPEQMQQTRVRRPPHRHLRARHHALRAARRQAALLRRHAPPALRRDPHGHPHPLARRSAPTSPSRSPR